MEFKALEDMAFVKMSKCGDVIFHDIIWERGKNILEKKRITYPKTLLECLKGEEVCNTYNVSYQYYENLFFIFYSQS